MFAQCHIALCVVLIVVVLDLVHALVHVHVRVLVLVLVLVLIIIVLASDWLPVLFRVVVCSTSFCSSWASPAGLLLLAIGFYVDSTSAACFVAHSTFSSAYSCCTSGTCCLYLLRQMVLCLLLLLLLLLLLFFCVVICCLLFRLPVILNMRWEQLFCFVWGVLPCIRLK